MYYRFQKNVIQMSEKAPGATALPLKTAREVGRNSILSANGAYQSSWFIYFGHLRTPFHEEEVKQRKRETPSRAFQTTDHKMSAYILFEHQNQTAMWLQCFASGDTGQAFTSGKFYHVLSYDSCFTCLPIMFANILKKHSSSVLGE